MTTDAQAFAQLQKLPPADAVSYLQERQQVVETFGWQDLWQEEHTRQFTISRLAQADLLAALQEMITQSVQGDLSRRDFARNARQMLADAGWWGPREVIEPETGEIHKTTFDSSRMKLVFDVNTRQAYAAGQWERIQRSKTTHPFLRYITKREERVRASHRSWDNITLPIDDQFWHTHYPPNGWRCRCRVTAVSQAEFDKGVAPSGQPMVKVAPDVVLRDWLNRRSGEVEQVPAGIDPGWAYNPGLARHKEQQRVVQGKLLALDAPLGAALWTEIKGVSSSARLAEWQELLTSVSASKRASGATALVHVVDAETLKGLAENGVQLASAAVLMRDTELLHALRDSKSARGTTLPKDVWEELPTLLEGARPFLDTEDRALIYGLDLPERAGKVVVRVNYSDKGRLGAQRVRVTANFVQTGGIVDEFNLQAARYAPLKKA